jgi:hypothetical protein
MQRSVPDNAQRLNPAWVAFFSEALRLAELARTRRAERESRAEREDSAERERRAVQESTADPAKRHDGVQG